MVIELGGPRNFDENPVIGPHQEPDGIGLDTRRVFAATPCIPWIAAPRQFIDRKFGGRIRRACSCEYFAQGQEGTRQKQRARHYWTL
jgi:hypothetical protein